jgi:hypothetical protein
MSRGSGQPSQASAGYSLDEETLEPLEPSEILATKHNNRNELKTIKHHIWWFIAT